MDTFPHYWRLVQRKLPSLLLLSVAAAAFAWIIVSRVGPTYAVHYSYLVSLSEREGQGEFRFDGYYALSATDLFAATLASWVSAPEVVVAAYKEAGLELVSRDPRDVGRAVRAEKRAPQLVSVTVQGKNQAVAEQLAGALQQVVLRNVVQYHDQGIPAVTFRVVATEPWSSERQVEIEIVTIAVFVLALFVGVNVVILMESIKQIT